MKQTNERGIALVLSLFLLLAVSIVGASLMFLSQTETYSSLNYQMMSQARYGAESGIQKAANYLLYTYAAPSTGGADSIASYVTTVSPVTYNGNPVILSANSSIASNYPVGSVQTAFSAAVQGSLTAGTTSVQYAPYATLVSMEEVPASQSVSGSAFTIQTWQITADGSISTGQRKAQVQVTAIIDTQKISSSSASLNYAAFATAATCGAIQLSGSAATDSYDSSTVFRLGWDHIREWRPREQQRECGHKRQPDGERQRNHQRNAVHSSSRSRELQQRERHRRNDKRQRDGDRRPRPTATGRFSGGADHRRTELGVPAEQHHQHHRHHHLREPVPPVRRLL